MRGTTNSQDIFNLQRDDWNSEFFNRNFGIAKLNKPAFVEQNVQNLSNQIQKLLKLGYDKNFNLIQLDVGIEQSSLIEALQESAFHLVETKVIFVTEINDSAQILGKNDYKYCRLADMSDMDQIFNLTREAFTYNSSFYSRFKNRRYFSPDETKKYYDAWVKNNLLKDGSFIAVYTKSKNILGYTLILEKGLYADSKLYKAALSAVRFDYWGKEIYSVLSNYAFCYIGLDKFFFDNTTQITNLAMLRRYIKLKRNLSRIEHIFYWKPEAV